MRKKYFFILLCGLLLFLPACSMMDLLPDETIEEITVPQKPQDEVDQSTGVDASYNANAYKKYYPDQEDVEKRQAIGLTESEITTWMDQMQGLFYYDHLNMDEKRLYVEIYQIVAHHGEDIAICSYDTDVIDKAYRYMLNDHPEIFEVPGYTYSQYLLGDSICKVTFTGDYTLSLEETRHLRQSVEEIVRPILDDVSKLSDDYAKAKYIYDTIIVSTNYNENAIHNQSILSVFLYQESVCQGYAKATQYLLNSAGIPATIVTGTVTGGDRHAWNLVMLDGDYYYLDTTWGDISYQNAEYASYATESYPTINYDYFGSDTVTISKTHNPDAIVDYPVCVAAADNYFVREKKLYHEVDTEQLKRMFDAAYENGDTYVTFRCADEAVFDKMNAFLFEQGNLFEYMQMNSGSASYAVMEEVFTITIWL